MFGQSCSTESVQFDWAAIHGADVQNGSNTVTTCGNSNTVVSGYDNATNLNTAFLDPTQVVGDGRYRMSMYDANANDEVVYKLTFTKPIKLVNFAIDGIDSGGSGWQDEASFSASLSGTNVPLSLTAASATPVFTIVGQTASAVSSGSGGFSAINGRGTVIVDSNGGYIDEVTFVYKALRDATNDSQFIYLQNNFSVSCCVDTDGDGIDDVSDLDDDNDGILDTQELCGTNASSSSSITITIDLDRDENETTWSLTDASSGNLGSGGNVFKW
ncbi:hypothetical protein [Tenacibaculum retecalamus]|uniref:hypothetical protein n=1 Tax=Tenacibaculum retecalamus TaxID=3018315 RepID=UPI0023D92E5B|nr:hypothetical protein [Tenacibaculum retecalamus]WBX72063.1 hypothetical protein PG912_04660 [Tenacibaculum retecalamus]